MIPEVRQRATPERATIHLDIRLDVQDYLFVAIRSAWMSLILMAGVLLFLVGYAATGSTVSPAAEVLAIVLTLFATIQASRIPGPRPFHSAWETIADRRLVDCGVDAPASAAGCRASVSAAPMGRRRLGYGLHGVAGAGYSRDAVRTARSGRVPPPELVQQVQHRAATEFPYCPA